MGGRRPRPEAGHGDFLLSLFLALPLSPISDDGPPPARRSADLAWMRMNDGSGSDLCSMARRSVDAASGQGQRTEICGPEPALAAALCRGAAPCGLCDRLRMVYRLPTGARHGRGEVGSRDARRY